MDEFKFDQDDIIGLIDWNEFFDQLPDGANALDLEPPPLGHSSSLHTFSNPSPDSLSSWITDIENILMKDDQDNVSSVPTQDCCDSFVADVIVEVDSHERESSAVDAAIDVDSNASDCGDAFNKSQNQKVDDLEINDGLAAHADDPVSKKRRRQLRNRDAAVRSRERKKVYVKDLEMKNKFLEGECRRLGRLLQCYYAENQALRFSLQMGCASGASLAKQESAVLLLESLLLGSLLWLVGIVCLFSLSKIPQLILDPVPLVIMAEEGPGSARLNVGRNKNFRYTLLQSFQQTRRCKAARTRMKSISLDTSIRYAFGNVMVLTSTFFKTTGGLLIAAADFIIPGAGT